MKVLESAGIDMVEAEMAQRERMAEEIAEDASDVHFRIISQALEVFVPR
jgi:hypothetical protein